MYVVCGISDERVRHVIDVGEEKAEVMERRGGPAAGPTLVDWPAGRAGCSEAMGSADVAVASGRCCYFLYGIGCQVPFFYEVLF